MRELVIGDVHFGIKTNSVTWLETQLEFFNKQVIPAIKEKHINRVIFLGDIFDIRYAVNQQVGIEVKSLIDEAYVNAQKLLIEHRDKLDAIAQTLLTQEKINEQEFKEIFGE